MILKTLALLFVLPTLSMAAGNPNAAVQEAMKTYVNGIVEDRGTLPIVYQGKVIPLKVARSEKYPDGFHAGVVQKDGLFVSCADFTDAKGNRYDIDFLVAKVDQGYQVVQPIVHSVNGKKNKYDLSH